MFSLQLMERSNPICHPLWTGVTRRVGELLLAALPRTEVVVEGREKIGSGPVIVAPNHTHKFDFFPIRCALLPRHKLMTWIKAREYVDPKMAHFLGKTGNIPLASRGFVIAADFRATVGRKPSEQEYRSLRDAVDAGASELPASCPTVLAHRPRSILGTGCDPSDGGYVQAIRFATYRLMQQSLALAERGKAAGHHQHIYPQGATSSKLTPGRIGAVQSALALKLPIVPVGVSGCREAFVASSPVTRGGTIRIRIGERFELRDGLVPSGFRPFHPHDEQEHRASLEEETQRLMEVINGLCEPSYQWASDGLSDAKRGIARFYS